MRETNKLWLIGRLLAALTGLLCGCQTLVLPARVQFWAVPPGETVFPDSPRQRENDVFSEAGGRISLRAAVNESVACQLALRSFASGSAVTRITCGDLAGAEASIPAAQTRLYVVRYVPISAYPAWFYQRTEYRREVREFPDILVPAVPGANVLPVELSPDRNTLFWIELQVPPGTPRGSYTGQLEFAMRDGTALRLPLTLEVWPFALPDLPHVTAIAPLHWQSLISHHIEADGKPYRPARISADDTRRAAALGTIDSAFRVLRAHRCQPVLTDLYPQRRVTPDGGVEIDWTEYDSAVSAYLDGSAFDDRVPLPVWPLPVDERFPPPEVYGGAASPAYAEALRGTLGAAIRHFQERGWLDRHVILLQEPGRLRGDEYAAWEQAATRVRSAARNVRLVCELPPQSLASAGWVGHPFRPLGDLVGAWCPPARYSLPGVGTVETQSGAVWRWWQPDQPPYSGSLAVVSPPCDIRSIGWQAAAWSSGAVWLTGAADWPNDATVPSKPLAVTADTRWLLYPGKPFGLDTPVPSIRLKHLHRGLQDAEYLWLLRRQQRPAIADLIAGGLFRFGGASAYGEQHADGRAHGWERDPAMWRLARDLMAAELARAAEGSPAEDYEQFRQRLDWQRFLNATRSPIAWMEGVRVSRGGPASPAARAEAFVCLANPSSRAIQVRPVCSPPAGWQTVDTAGSLAVPPGAESRLMLVLKAAQIDPDTLDRNGTLPLPVRLEGDGSPAIEVAGRLAVLQPLKLTRPITIDGRLDDWPPAVRNQAGDFLLVGGQDIPKAGGSRPDRPSDAVSAFVCYDKDALYVAFNCPDTRIAEREQRQTNYVRYEGMTPTGEDLVEVVLDPGGKAKSVGDLYHLVVKANGAVVTERGIGCSPPIGASDRWLADVRVGVDATAVAGRWFVEIRLGWSSFEKDVAGTGCWGINFTRLQGRLGEYSSWSGARWNVYSPRTLGNLVFPPP